MKFTMLIISLPTENATIRMRAWRALKSSGAAVLRDGVYLMPDDESCGSALESIATDVRSGGGVAHLLRVVPSDDENFTLLFDRSDDYAALFADITKTRNSLSNSSAQGVLKQSRKLRKAFGNLASIDFFPGEAQRQTDTALQELELATARALSPDEPSAIEGVIQLLSIDDYQGRVWATRKRPWVDRLASAWLIQCFIDASAQFMWLSAPNQCPANALGFDFDGATFSHIGNRVTFEVLMESFGLEHPALKRLGALVHYLDVGGVQPPEASGIESVLAGLRETITDDNQLLNSACDVFNGLFATFAKGEIQ